MTHRPKKDSPVPEQQRVRGQAKVPADLSGSRADVVAAQLFPEHSRARLQEWMSDGQLTVDGAAIAPKRKVFVDQQFVLDAQIEPTERWEAQPIPLDLVYEDESLLVIDKPAGLVVHPAAGNPDGTLLNALLNHAPELEQIPRCGIVHRIDKETSGLLAVARTLTAQTSLVRQLQSHSMQRRYRAVCSGVLTAGGTVDAPIGRHPTQRTRMAVVRSGKPSVTHYRVARRFGHFTELRLELETGRTHQIRVHMAHIRHPLVGDPVYAGRQRLPGGIGETLAGFLREFHRQALHAEQLELEHPETGEWLRFSSELPEDMKTLLDLLAREDHGES